MPNFTGGENMLMTALLAGQKMEQARQMVGDLMKKIGLPPRAFTVDISEISGGQRQRLAFIRAIVSNYSVLFGDEPTGNLDANTARQCFDVLQEAINEQGKTAIIVSHDLALATEYADLIIPIKVKVIAADTLQGFTDTDSRLYRNKDGVLVKEGGIAVSDPADYLQSEIFQPLPE
jgi:ABC-type lipoprotein export system ATPase subunit